MILASFLKISELIFGACFMFLGQFYFIKRNLCHKFSDYFKMLKQKYYHASRVWGISFIFMTTSFNKCRRITTFCDYNKATTKLYFLTTKYWPIYWPSLNRKQLFGQKGLFQYLWNNILWYFFRTENHSPFSFFLYALYNT